MSLDNVGACSDALGGQLLPLWLIRRLEYDMIEYSDLDRGGLHIVCIHDEPEHLGGHSMSSPFKGLGRGAKNRRRVVAVFLLASVTLFTLPSPAHGGVGISFDIFSVGPLSFGVDLALEEAFPLAALFIVGKALFSFFSSDSRDSGDSYSASYPSGGLSSAPVIVTSRVTIDRDDHLHGEPIRIKYNELIHDNRINLPRGGCLEISDDGKMIFRNSSFSGYAYIHYNHTLSVWDDKGTPVLVVVPQGDQTLILQEKSPRASEVLGILFGSVVRKLG